MFVNMFDKDVRGPVRLLRTNMYVYVRYTVMYTLTKINKRNNFYFSIDNIVFKYYVLMHKVNCSK